MAKIRANQIARVAKYEAKYSVKLENHQAFEIERAERHNELCEKCPGYPCANAGFQTVIKFPDGKLDIRYRECAERLNYNAVRRQKRLFNLSKIPLVYEGKTFDDYTTDADNRVAVAWVKEVLKTPVSLYLYGEPGTGKTFLAAIFAQEALKRGQSVIFADVPSLLSDLRGTFDKEADTTINDLMKVLSETDWLILDDFGTERPTQWSIERLYMIVNERYNRMRPMVITSNYDLDKAEQVLNRPKDGGADITGSRIVSRLGQMSKLLRLKGTDRRRK